MKAIITLLGAILIITAVHSTGMPVSLAEAENGVSDIFWQTWTEGVNVSQSPQDAPEATWATLDTSDDGRFVYLAWSDRRETWQDIYYSLSIDGGWNWATTRPVAATSSDSLRPSLVVSGTSPVVTWAEAGTGLTHTTYQWAQATGEILQVPNKRTWLASASRLASGPDGDLHLVMQGGVGTNPDILYTRRDVGASSWPTATVVFEHTASGSHNPAIAVSADGQSVHLVWQENAGSNKSSIYYLRGNREGQGMNWETPISLTLGITRSVRPFIALGAGSTVHVAWGEQTAGVQEQYVRHIRSDDGGASWGNPGRVAAEPIRANNVAPTDVAPALAVMPSGALCVTWHGFFSGVSIEAEEIYIACSTDRGDTWSSPVNVSNSPGTISIRPMMAIGSDGIVHVAWQELVGDDPISNYQVYYARSYSYSVLMPIIRR